MGLYALRDLDPRIDGEGLTWWLHFEVGGRTPHIGPFPLEKAEERGWWRVPSWTEFDPDTSIVEVVSTPGRVVTHYRRTREVEDYPETLSIEEYERQTDDEDETYDSLVRPLYEAVHEDLPPTRQPIEGPWLVLDGAPPPNDGMEWTADLPHLLRYQPQYRHLFSGKFLGFRKALADALAEVPGVSVYGANGSGCLSVSIRLTVPKLEPPEKWAARPHLHGLTARDRRRALEAHNSGIQQITRQLEIPVTDYVTGPNRAEARALWDETIAEVVEYVRGVVAQRCPTCGGRGFVDSEHHHKED